MKKLKFIDKVRVENPCNEEWEQMVGNDKVRFCSHCAKHVNNFSEMRRKEAIRLVRKYEGRLCIRYMTDPNTDAPIFADDMVRISRRASKVAASVMTASLSLATLSYAQGGSSTTSSNVVSRADETSLSEKPDREHAKKPTSGTMSSISGTVSDPQGAVIPGAEIELLDEEDKEISHTTSNDDGFYIFEKVSVGSYTIRMTAPGFRANRIDATLEDEKALTVSGTLAIGAISGAIVVLPEFKGDLAKAVSRDDVNGARNLIAAGADVNGREEDKTTPLSIAVENGNLEIVRMLLDLGADVNLEIRTRKRP